MAIRVWTFWCRTLPCLPMFAVNIACYPWDLEDEGVDDVLDRLQGELGASGVTVVAAGQPICQLRHNPHVTPRIFQSRGGLFFPPDESRYKDTRCKPVVSGWVKGRNPLKKISEACRRRAMALRAVLDTRRIGRIASHCPAVAAKTAFGDVSPGTICAANPDAVALFRNLMADLTSSYALSAIELRHLDRTFDMDLVDALEAFTSPGDAKGRPARTLDEAARALLAICFCESCQQSAFGQNIDAGAAMRSAQVRLNDVLSLGRALPGSFDELLADDEALGSYVVHRRAEHTALIGMLSRHAGCDVVLHISDDMSFDRPPLAAMASECAAIIVSVPGPPSQARGSTLTDALKACRTNKPLRCEAQVPAREPPSDDAAVLVRTLKQLVDDGVAGVTLDHYGLMGEREFTSATQAIRYAQRSAAD